MQKKEIGGLIAALLLLLGALPATAVPTISIDLDPGTAGIQSTRSVTSGSSFMIDVVFTGDGATLFDTFAFDAVFNDLGAILGLTGGTGSPTAGGIAATAPILALDAFSAAAVVSGSALTPSGVPFPVPVGFTGQSDGVGILSIVLPFGGGPIGAGVTIDLFSLTLDALIPGMSTVLPSAGVIPPPLGGLVLAGAPVPFTVATGGTVTVTPSGEIPEPSNLLLFGLGFAGLSFSRRRKV